MKMQMATQPTIPKGEAMHQNGDYKPHFEISWADDLGRRRMNLRVQGPIQQERDGGSYWGGAFTRDDLLALVIAAIEAISELDRLAAVEHAA
jgi:hypothetical protein